MPLRPRSEPPGPRKAAILLVIALVVWPAVAQVPEGTPRIRPRSLGPFLLYPLVALESETTDNLFATDKDPVDSNLTTAAAGFILDLPLRESSARLGYLGRYRDYDAVDVDQQVGHSVDLGLDLGFSSGAFLGLSGTLEDGAYDTRLFDPGGELTFRPESFRAWSGGIEVGHESRGRRVLALRLSRDRLDFDRAAGATGALFDLESDGVTVRGEHVVASRLRFLWDATLEREDRSRPDGPVLDERRTDGVSGRVGFRWDFGRRATFEALAGWTDRTYERDGGENDYAGPVARVRFRRSVPAGLRLEVGADRVIYSSSFGSDDYYVSEQFRVRLENAIDARVGLGGSLAAFANGYDSGSTDRDDDLVEARAWIGYRFAAGVTWEAYVERRSRNSTLPGFDYDETRIGTSVRLGY